MPDGATADENVIAGTGKIFVGNLSRRQSVARSFTSVEWRIDPIIEIPDVASHEMDADEQASLREAFKATFRIVEL